MVECSPILEVLFAALTEHTVRHEVSIGVVFVDWLIVPCPLALIGIPAETVESLKLGLSKVELVLSLIASSFG